MKELYTAIVNMSDMQLCITSFFVDAVHVHKIIFL